MADPLHQFVLHVNTYRSRRVPPFNRVRVAEESEERLRLVSYEEREDGSIGAEERFGLEVTVPNLLRVELMNAAPGGNVRVVMLMTPVDEDHALICFLRGQRVSGLARLRWQLYWHARFRRVVDHVVGQDEAMLCTLGPLAATRGREHLASSDLGVIRFRAKLNRAFKRGRQPAVLPTDRAQLDGPPVAQEAESVPARRGERADFG